MYITMDPNDSTDIIFALIRERWCYPEFRLIHKHGPLWRGHTLNEYDIKEGDMITMIQCIRKPVIYIYPEEEIEVNVKIENKKGEFTFVYPEFDEGTSWQVTAKPGGEIVHKGKKLNYLFWESSFYSQFDFSKGFCVHKTETTAFLERTLKKFNLNDKEICDFVTYWAPRLVESEYSLISFQLEQYDENFPLIVSPKPDHIIRVFMAAKSLKTKIEIEPQDIPTYNRDGYCIVEWGGSIL